VWSLWAVVVLFYLDLKCIFVFYFLMENNAVMHIAILFKSKNVNLNVCQMKHPGLLSLLPYLNWEKIKVMSQVKL